MLSITSRFTFQSSRPVRGATPRVKPVSAYQQFQSSRPVRGATRTPPTIIAGGAPWISILAPRAGRDFIFRCVRHDHANFNPRAPCGARQQKCTNFLAFFAINSQSKIEIQRPAQAGRAIYTFMQTAMPVKPSANLLSIGCSLAVRTISSVYLPANKFPCSRNARSSFRTAFPDSKTANYRAWDP